MPLCYLCLFYYIVKSLRLYQRNITFDLITQLPHYKAYLLFRAIYICLYTKSLFSFCRLEINAWKEFLYCSHNVYSREYSSNITYVLCCTYIVKGKLFKYFFFTIATWLILRLLELVHMTSINRAFR